MRPLIIPARKRIAGKGSVKKQIQYSIDCVMKQSVSDTGFMDISRLRVVNSEIFVAAVFVSEAFQLSVKLQNIIHQIQLKFLDVSFLSLASQKLFPRF
jgi:hypothetical protein